MLSTLITSDRFSLGSTGSQRHGTHAAQNNSGKALLISAVSVFLVSQFPMLINDLLGIFSAYPFCSFRYRNYANIAQVTDVLARVPYSVNFFIYFASSQNFRAQTNLLVTTLASRMKAVMYRGVRPPSKSLVIHDPFTDLHHEIYPESNVTGKDPAKPGSDTVVPPDAGEYITMKETKTCSKRIKRH